MAEPRGTRHWQRKGRRVDESSERDQRLARLMRCAQAGDATAYGQLLNYFHASLKLDRKEHPEGGKVRRIYGVAQTPLARVLASAEVSEATKQQLRKHKAGLNPFALKQAVTRSLKMISALRRQQKY